LWAIIILNDLAETKGLLKTKERRVRMENERKEIERQQVTIELDETDEQYSQDLEEKLDKIHLQLVKACAKRKTNKNNK